MNTIMAVILSVLPNLISAIQAIVTAIEGGQPVTPAHLAALRASLDALHDGVVAAVAPTNNP